jgi:methyl-accepting chemotaxis protein
MRKKMTVFLVLMVVLLLFLALFSIRNMQRLSDTGLAGLESIKTENSLTAAIEAAHVHFQIQVHEWKNILIRGNEQDRYQKHLVQFNRENQIVQSQLKIVIYLMQQLGLPTDDAELLKTTHFNLNTKYTEALQQFDPINPQTGKSVDQLVRGIDRPVSEEMEALVRVIETHFYQEIKKEVDAITTITDSSRWEFLMVVGLGLLGAALLSWWMLRDLMRQLGGEPSYASQIAHRIARDDLEMDIQVVGKAENSVLAAIKIMQQALKNRIAAERAIAAENLRIRFALDNVTIPVTVSDDQHALVYFNHAGKQLWQSICQNSKRNQSECDVNKMLGTRLSNYFEDEVTRTAYRTEFNEVHMFDTIVSQRHLRVTVSPVHSNTGVYEGRVTQWLDRTTEVAIEQKIAALVFAAAQGDLMQRVTIADKDGFFRQLAEGLNQLMIIVASGLNDLAEVLNAVAKGDLTRTITAEYAGVFGQLKNNTNMTVERLRDIVAQMSETTTMVNTAAQEIAAGNTNLAARTEEQASNLQQTVANMETLNGAVSRNADNAIKANGITRHANEIVQQGGDMVQSVVATMGAIQISSNKIADIISVIDSIAFQTNILALNAAVEAARAGELGRGFAVVAAEVRNLAQRSAQAAKETKALIDDSVGRINEGVHLVEGTGRTMAELVSSFRQVATLITEISDASREQSGEIAEMTQAVGQMDAMTQQNAALVEQAATAAESLSDQAQSLAEIVSVFRVRAAA